MKKNLFFLATAALALAACSNDLKVDENTAPAGSNVQKEIAFTSYAQRPMHAPATNGAIENDVFPDTLDMMVAAYDVTHTRDFFAATAFKKGYVGGSDASGTYWGGDPAKYWPLAPAYINFLAITSTSNDNATNVTWGTTGANHASKVVVVMADNYAIGTKQHDFIYAIGHGEVEQSGNVLTFPEKVDMTFKHAQAYLTFKVKAFDAASTGIKIKNIEIYNARFAGTATITQENYNANASQATHLYWNPTTPTAEYKSVLDDQTAKANEGASVALTTSLVQMGKIMVVPNMDDVDSYADNGTTKIKITYYLGGIEYTYEYELDNDTYEAGKKYIYNIVFKLHEIYISPEVEEWDEQDAEHIDVPVTTFKYVESTSETGTFTLPAAVAGTYSCDIAGLPAGSYKVVEAAADPDFVTAVSPATSTTISAGEVLHVSFTVTASSGNSQNIKISDGSSDFFTITITQP